MNKTQFVKAAGISDELAGRWFVPLSAAMNEFGIIKPLAQAMFIAQVGHESAGFTVTVENLNYTPEALQSTFGTTRFTDAVAQSWGRTPAHPANQQKIANIAYGGRMGNTDAGDGWKYRGRGLIQITGHDNYKDCGTGLGTDLLLVPQLLEQDEYAARSAAWYWKSRNCGDVAGDIEKVTKLINGGQNGLADRKTRFEQAKVALNA